MVFSLEIVLLLVELLLVKLSTQRYITRRFFVCVGEGGGEFCLLLMLSTYQYVSWFFLYV